jgi:predicted porin
LVYTYNYFDEMVYTIGLVNTLTSYNTVVEHQYHVFSMEYIYKDLLLAAEYGIEEYDSKQAIPGAGIYTTPENRKSGDRYYVNASYRFTDWFESGIYYSKFEEFDDTDSDDGKLDDICLSLRFDINESWITKLEVHKMEGLYGVFPEEDGTIDKDWMLYAVKLSYNF